MAIHLRRISWILVSQDPDISLDLDLRPGLIPLTASPPQIHLALIISISKLCIVSTKHSRSDSSPDRAHITKNKQRKRFETTTMDSESEVHLDTEVDTAVDSDNEPTPNICYLEVEIGKKKHKQASPTQLT